MNKIILYILFLSILGACSGNESVDDANISLVINNVMIVDGSGQTPYKGSVAISGNKIHQVSEDEITAIPNATVIDGGGKILTPGFIDLHAHGDPAATPEFQNFLAMGVTTICLGMDGSSPETINLGDWQSGVYGDGFGTNIAMFIGHGTLRQLAGIGNKAIPTRVEMDSMISILEKNLPFVYGMSLGLEYTPGLFASRDELNMLAKYIGMDRMIMSHMRNEDDSALFSSIDELVEQGKFTRVHISHLKSVYGKGISRAEEILDHLYDIRAKGINLTADMYPYTASYTGISIVFPEWAKTREQFEYAKANRRGELREFLTEKVNSRNGPEATLFGTEPYAGKTLADLEKNWGIPFADILIDSIGPNGASGAYFVMDERLQDRLLQDSLIAVCSDGSPGGYHPRGHGTYARIIEDFVVRRKILSLEQAVYKMTGYPAAILGLRDRGLIRSGYAADLVLFDPSNVHEKASYDNPFQLASGFDLVVVNGKVAWQDEKASEGLHGEFLIKN